MEALPGSKGIEIPKRLTPDQMRFLQNEHGVEFSQVYQAGPGKNGGGGVYKLYSGSLDGVTMEGVNGNTRWINHTHPTGRPQTASSTDMNTFNLLKKWGNPQNFSEVIPVDGPVIKFNTTNSKILK